METKNRGYQFVKRAKPPGRVVQLVGQRFGYLTVISRAGRIGRNASWRCRCDCGVERIISSAKLRANRVKSCNTNGHRFIVIRPMSLRLQYPSELSSWERMRQRCKNPNNHKFSYYGGRGIKICNRWNLFENFIIDMGKKPDSKFTIERIDVNGHYAPGNCRWVSRAEQCKNRTDTVMISYQGRDMKLIDVVGELGLSRGIVYGRLKAGWPLDLALGVPVKHYKK